MYAILILLFLYIRTNVVHAARVPIILDMDLATDVDDVGALAVLHALADDGAAEVLGIMHNTGTGTPRP